MNSKQVKEAFAAAGFRVRVADQGLKFRVCQLGDLPYADTAAVKAVAASLGMTDVLGHPGCLIGDVHEAIAYKPGCIRRVGA